MSRPAITKRCAIMRPKSAWCFGSALTSHPTQPLCRPIRAFTLLIWQSSAGFTPHAQMQLMSAAKKHETRGLRARVARFVAAVGMEKLTARTGRHSLMVLALEKRRESRFNGWLDRLVTELFITGAVHAHGHDLLGKR